MDKAMTESALEKMIQVGDRAIELVRVKIKNQGGYDNHTGNLRSSTGYIIYKEGKILYRNFKESPEGTDKKTGLETGIKSATSELRTSTGWGIILVSGMEYAGWVEDKGYDVLTGATIGYEEALQQAFNEIGLIDY
jgi:hypothetical protein